MAYNPANVALIDNSSVGLPTSERLYLWKYTTSDNLSAVEASDYFNDELFRQGDIVAVEAGDGKKIYRFNGVEPGTVNIVSLATVNSFPY